MSEGVASELVEAAIAAARERGRDVAEVSLGEIAVAAGISRSTLLRRLGGSRAVLDAAVRAAGVDPGGRPPVRERAIEATARLISEHGLGSVTLDAVAAAAACSLPSLHAIFSGRDGLLTAVFDRYSPMLDMQALAADPPERLEDAVRGIYGALIAAFGREPRVLPAILADLLSRPEGPARTIMVEAMPRLLAGITMLLGPHLRAGRLRPLPMPLLIQLMIGPLAVHMLVRPTMEAALGPGLPDVEQVCEIFADGFLRAVAV